MSKQRLMVNFTVVCSEHGSPLVLMPDGSVRCPIASLVLGQQIACPTVTTREGAIAAIGESVASALVAAGYDVRKKSDTASTPEKRKDWS